MTVFLLSLAIILFFVLGCYWLFSVQSGEGSFFEPSEWYNDWSDRFRITKLPYGYIVEQNYGTDDNLWHHQYKYVFRNGYLVETISHFKTYEEAKAFLFEEHKELKYEHL